MLRYLVQRISDGEFLDLELPIDVSGAGPALCAPGKFGGTIAPDIGGVRDASGRLLIDPNATWIHEEADGVIRGTWIVTRSEIEGESWKIEGAGFSSIPKGVPYEGEYRGVQVDPVGVARHVVDHVQSFAGAKYGIKLVGSSSVRVGTESDAIAEHAKAQVADTKQQLADRKAQKKIAEEVSKAVSKRHDDAIKKLTDQEKALKASHTTALSEANKAQTAYDKAVKDKKPAAEIAALRATLTAKNSAAQTALIKWDEKRTEIYRAREFKDSEMEVQLAAVEKLKKDIEALDDELSMRNERASLAAEQAREDDGAWKLLWWDTPDCFVAMCDAIEAAGMEWYEWSGWNADRTAILKEIRVVDRVGRKQDDLRFIEGDNVIEKVVFEDNTADYANAVVAIGAGEGRAALRVSLAIADGRMRKPRVLDAKHITNRAALERYAQAELNRLTRHLQVKALRVDASHPNAARGTFGVGDTIIVDAESGWIGRQTLWRRIKEVEWMGLDVVDLILEDT